MGITVNGAGCAGSPYPAVTGTLTIKNANQDARARIAHVQKKSTTATKKLNYNYREISGQLMRAKKVQGAANTLARAKGKLGVLQRNAASGQYDKREVEAAIAHARRMIECAQMKVRHLKEEEQERHKHRQDQAAQKQSAKAEVKRRAASKERQLEQKAAIETMQQVQHEKARRQQMIQKQNRHRRLEHEKINEADMKYLKEQMEHKDSADGGSEFQAVDSGAILQLSAEAAMLNEAQIKMQAQQEAEQELAGMTGMEGMTDGAALTGAAFGMSTGSAPESVEAAPAGMDVSV